MASFRSKYVGKNIEFHTNELANKLTIWTRRKIPIIYGASPFFTGYSHLSQPLDALNAAVELLSLLQHLGRLLQMP